MQYKNFALLIVMTIAMTGCDINLESQGVLTATPDFVTAILPATPISAPTQTPPPPTAIPTIIPVEGTTTTQVNVRAETSTTSESLGLIAPFSTVQITGKDASGTWVQIIYGDSPIGLGWVRAEYVQVDVSAEIPLISIGSASAMSGLVVQKVNVRNGPGTTFETLGVLNPNDVVSLTGQDSSGAWIQIEYANAPDGKGWVASEFLEIDNTDSLPVIAQAEQSPGSIGPTATGIILLAPPDGDSLTAPLAKVIIGPSNNRALHVNGEISVPSGDAEDWIEFSSYSAAVTIRVDCSNYGVQVELWNNGTSDTDFLLACGEERLVSITSNSPHILRVSYPASNENSYTKYNLSVEALR